MPSPAQAPSAPVPAHLALAHAELARGAREDPPGSNTGPDVRRYLAGCVRGGRRLGLTVGPWCAAFTSWCVWEAWALDPDSGPDDAQAWSVRERELDPALPPIGYRASVAELCADARATGALRLPQAGEAPMVGDILIYGGPNGENPLHGGHGHATFCAAWEQGNRLALGGNEGDAVREMVLGANGEHPTAGPLLAWIRV